MPTIDAKLGAGTNANDATETSLSVSYNHPGGALAVFFYHADSLSANYSVEFNSTSIPVVDVTAASPGFDSSISGVAVIDDIASANDTVTISWDDARRRRAAHIYSIGSTSGQRTGGHNASNFGADDDINPTLSVTSEDGDLVLGFLGWRNSGIGIDSRGAGQTDEISDDSPTRCQSDSKDGDASSTTLEWTFDANDATNRQAMQLVSFEEAAGGGETGSASVGAEADVAVSAVTTALADLSLPATVQTTPAGVLQALAQTTLSAQLDAEFTSAVQGDFAGDITLAIDSDIQQTATGQYVAELTIPASLAETIQAVNAAQAQISLPTTLDIDFTAESAIQGDVSLAVTGNIQNTAQADLLAALVIPTQMDLTATANQSLLDDISLAVEAAEQQEGNVGIRFGQISLDASLDMTQVAQAEFQASITLGASLDIADQVIASYAPAIEIGASVDLANQLIAQLQADASLNTEAGIVTAAGLLIEGDITLSATASLTIEGTTVQFDLETPDGRVLTVTAGNRVLIKSAPKRTLQ